MTISEWMERYSEVEDEYEAEMEREGKLGITLPSQVFYDHDDALAELAHEAAGIFADLLLKERGA